MAQGIGAAEAVLIAVAALWLVGVGIATPFVVWWTRDAGRIPGRIWYWSGHDRRAWQWAVLLGWVFGGVIAIATVLRWRRGAVRADLLDELRERRAAHDVRVAEEQRRAGDAQDAEDAEDASITLESTSSLDLRPVPAPPREGANVSRLRPDPGASTHGTRPVVVRGGQ